MAKKKSTKPETKPKPETKSDFLRKALTRNPNLTYDQILRRWAKAGHAGGISSPLYYKVRADLGIKTVWTWVGPPVPEPPLTEVYQFKITLNGSNPPIWRRIQVGNGSLDKLHEHIQTSMGWTNSHMHHFRIGEKLYGDPMLTGENLGDMDYADSTTTKLSDILPPDGKSFRFLYEYDFGDSWEHDIFFEGRLPADPKQKYPLCVEGEMACPPEDCGGIWGYAEFVEAISDPDNEQYREMLDWVGGKFDPSKFSPSVATRKMKDGLPNWR